jgi:hypothetical protein
MSTRTITGTVLDSAGNAATGTVHFVLERGTWSATEHAAPDETTATLTAGAFSISVYTPARYKVYLPNGYHFGLTVPAGSATTLEALRLADETLPDLSSVLDDFLAALEINGLDYAAGQTPRWDGDSWEPADYYTEAESDALYALVAHSHAFADLTAKPTTLAGYGITDAYTEAEVDALLTGYLTQAAGDARYGRLGAANTWALAQTFTGQVLGKTGNTPAGPSFAFTGDDNTGIYSSGADALSIATGGTLRWDVSTSTIRNFLPQWGQITSATTNTAIEAFRVRGLSTGTPATNFGAFFSWQLQSSTTQNLEAATERAYWSDATHASRTSRFAIQTVYNAGSAADTIAAGRTGVADSTGLWLYDESAASLKQVTRGAADSGGAGFRMLRVAN